MQSIISQYNESAETNNAQITKFVLIIYCFIKKNVYYEVLYEFKNGEPFFALPFLCHRVSTECDHERDGCVAISRADSIRYSFNGSKYNTKKNRYTITVSDKELEPLYSGEFLKLNFQVGEDVPVGTYTMTLTPAEVNLRGQDAITLPDITFTLTVREPATTFGATDVEIIPGRSEVSVVGFSTERRNDIAGVSFNVYVPDGLTIGAAEAISEAFSGTPTITLGNFDSANKCYPVTVATASPFLQSAEWNDFLNLTVVASEEVPSGDHAVRIADIEVRS